NRFHKEAEHLFFCPGRINLIGEHIDYNGGKVMPCAINLGTYLAVARNTEKLLRMQSMDFPEAAGFHLQDSYSKSGKTLYNYPLGVISYLQERDHPVSGLDLLFGGDLPLSSGLSSSASIEMVTGYALDDIFRMKVSRTDLALLCKKVENEFIGVNS